SLLSPPCASPLPSRTPPPYPTRRSSDLRLDPTENLANYGVDSIAITEVMVQIARTFAISIAPTTFFEAKHLDDLSRILRERYGPDRKSTRLNSSHVKISYAVFCLKKKKL